MSTTQTDLIELIHMVGDYKNFLTSLIQNLSNPQSIRISDHGLITYVGYSSSIFVGRIYGTGVIFWDGNKYEDINASNPEFLNDFNSLLKKRIEQIERLKKS